jgi:hypothetical protein
MIASAGRLLPLGRNVLAALAVVGLLLLVSLEARASCVSPANAIEAENCLTGTPDSTWDLPGGGVGDTTIQGYATDISVNQGGTINFKVNTPAAAYRLDIYRLGYYQGNGARLVATVSPFARLPQTQPACLTDSTTGLFDCGNWAVSASWTVPVNAASGIYFANVVRSDTGGASHIVFIVRNDSGRSALLFQASDTTWQAYNDYGGNSFYKGNPAGRAYKLSYNRPFTTRAVQSATWVFNAEYPMVRWLEANGFDVTYTTATDTDRNGALIPNHKVWMSNGHDEYWSAGERANVEAARAAGVHLAFFSGNAGFWKTRWENSIDGAAAPYRTLVCYKETHAGTPIDPADPPTWTGTWRDPRFSPPADGGRPENALNGTLFRVNGDLLTNITVPQADGRMRFWRNTPVASLATGQTATLATGSLGFEVDVDEDNGFRPPGIMHLSTTPISTNVLLVDYGSTFAPGTTVHSLTLYRHSKGALVFSTGVYNWAWGLDLNHDNPTADTAPDRRIQQATVNLFADMGVQPATLQAGLIAAAASTDTIAPTSTITSPAARPTFSVGQSVTIAGTAADTGGGFVAGVEVSTDNGTTWHPASGRESWTYTWYPNVVGTTTVRSRAVDDSGNLETPSAGVSVTVNPCAGSCSIWQSTQAPVRVDSGPDSAVELGVKFRSDVKGSVTGIRFYKASTNTGKHVGNLWTSTGTLLASATFTGETASGWQQVNFATPVSIAGNTTYVASYHTDVGYYSQDLNYFANAGADAPPLHGLANSVSPNGVYAYGSTSTFPNGSFSSANYWVDVVVNPTSISSVAVTPTNPTISTGTSQQFTAIATYSDGTTQDVTGTATWSSSNTTAATISAGGLATGSRTGSTTISATQSGVTGSTTLTVQMTPLTVTTTSLPDATQNAPYSVTVAAKGGNPPYTWSLASGTLPSGLSLSSGGVISGTPSSRGAFGFTVRATDAASQSATQPLNLIVAPPPVSIWAASATPGSVDRGADSAVELGVKFRSEVNGTITGIRFYKASTNTGTHVGNLWTSTGTLLASATFTNETASGWQQVNFASPVSITANTIYVASYHTDVGHYSGDQNYFASAGVDNPPLHALANGVSPDGVYAYGSASIFPTGTYLSTNYWVDVSFSAGSVSSVAVTPANATILTGSTKQFTAVATYSDGRTQDVTGLATWSSSNTTAAAISAGGLATAAQAGSTTISATQAGVTGSTTLTVQTAPLTITTTSLPDAAQNSPYSVTLAASGGTPPYKWSLASGTLPPGLGLSTGGVISGTPTTRGAFSFTVGVTDGTRSATQALNLTVSGPIVTIWAATAVPTNVDHGADAAVELGVKFRSDVNGTIKGIRFYKASTNTGTHVGNLWTSTGTLLASATFVGETASGWQQVNFSAPVSITANTIYVASYHTDVGHYSQDLNYFASMGVDSPPLHALASTASPDGVYAYGSTSGFPNGTYLSSNYWVDVVFVAP